jgi:apolipoprotein N-acyltransferase
VKMPPNLETWIKALSVLGAVVAFGWGVFQFVATQDAREETRRIEATKPFLERQLKLYTEATQAAATLATSKNAEELDTANERFWSLYWGELALVEDEKVEAAMVQFGRALEAGSVGQQLQISSLALAHACRDSLAESWGVKQWRKPRPASR